MEDSWLPLLVGPYGVVVVLVIAVIHLWRQNRELVQKLEAEHQARLEDAKANAAAMNGWNEELQRSVDQLGSIAVALTAQRPPTTTGTRTPQ